MDHFTPLLALLNNTSAVDRMKNAFFDDTFAGIHQLAWFDYSLLIPYFAVLIVLSFYGLHRYEMIRGFYKNRQLDSNGRQLSKFDGRIWSQLVPILVKAANHFVAVQAVKT